MMTPLRAVLLDIDGTLVDSNAAHAESWAQVFAEFGIHVEVARIRELIGKGGDKLLWEAAAVEEESSLGKELSERRKTVFKTQFLPGIKPLRGARGLLETMRERDLCLVVATSADRADISSLLEIAQVTDLIEATTSSSEAEHSKPDPDIIQAALKKAKASPAEALMLGDTPYDVEAATRASVGSVAVRCGGWNDAALQGALAIYDDPEDVRLHFETSPFCHR
jgi:HAD superfamily hydrolase (TIGR01509 family)